MQPPSKNQPEPLHFYAAESPMIFNFIRRRQRHPSNIIIDRGQGARTMNDGLPCTTTTLRNKPIERRQAPRRRVPIQIMTMLRVPKQLLMLLLPFILVLFGSSSSSSLWVSAQGEPCTTCFGGTEPTNLDGTTALGGLPCSFFANLVARTDEDSEFCQEAQIATYQGCGCPAFDEEVFCAMCDDGFWEIGSTRNRLVPLLEGSTCGDWLFRRRDSGLCDDVERVAHYCGCPNATAPICSFCPEGNPPPRGDALLPPRYNHTCDDLAILAPFSITNETCEALTADLPIDTEFYCGCHPYDTAPGTCSLCGRNRTIDFANHTIEVGGIYGGNMTCAEMGILAECVTDADYCDSLIEDFYGPCCLGIFTDAPTSMPTVEELPGTPTSAPTPATPVPRSAAAHHTVHFSWLLLRLGAVLPLAFVQI